LAGSLLCVLLQEESVTKIIYFVTPTTIIKIGNKATEWIPILSPSLEFTKKAKKVIEMADTVNASSQGIGILFNYCFGKAGTVSVDCILWLGFSIAGRATCNPGLIAAGAQFGNMVIDEIIG